MERYTSILAVFLTVLVTAQCQVHYVPAQVLIPTINGSILGFNSSAHQNPNPNNIGFQVPSYPNVQGGNKYPPGAYPSINNNTYYGNNYPNSNAQNVHSNNRFYGQNNYNYSRYNASYNASRDGHLILGQVGAYDRLLFSQVYKKEGRWYGNREKIIEFPQAVPAGYSRHEIISAIKCFNQFLDGNSARATILKGGVGYQYAKIKLESKWRKGFQYLVQIYGH